MSNLAECCLEVSGSGTHRACQREGKKQVVMNIGRLEGSPEEPMFAENLEWRWGFPGINAALGVKVSG